MRREFSKPVKFQALKRANGVCEGCGMPLRAARYAFDHDIPDALGGEPTLENCRVLCTGPGSCHAMKTERVDIPRIAKAKRVQAKHVLGIRKPSSFKGWRRFDGTPVRNPRA